MSRMHSHYDNLKVARNAPTEVIRAAYRALAQKYHPDVNNSPDAARIMRLLNEAWDVLGDPQKRARHDAWLHEQEQHNQEDIPSPTRTADFKTRRAYTYTHAPSAAPPHSRSENTSASSRSSEGASPAFREAAEWAKREQTASKSTGTDSIREEKAAATTDASRSAILVGFLILGIVGAAIVYSTKSQSSRDNNSQVRQPPASLPNNVAGTTSNFDRCKGSYEVQKCEELERRLLAETPEQRHIRQASVEATRRGQTLQAPAPPPIFDQARAQPTTDPEQLNRTGYVPGSLRASSNGLSEFTVDNTSGGGDAIARLYFNGNQPAVRTFFIKNGEKFTVKSLAPGIYVLRYRYMGSDDTFEADREFELRQVETEDGTSYSRVRVTLYTVRDGNLQTKKVPKDRF